MVQSRLQPLRDGLIPLICFRLARISLRRLLADLNQVEDRVIDELAKA